MDNIDFGISDPNAFFRGAENMGHLLERVTRRTAGKRLAGGDIEGAKSELNQGGLTEDALKLSDEQRKMAEEGRTDELHSDLLRQHLDTHNESIQTLTAKQQEESATFLYDVSDALSKVREQKGDVLKAFDQLVPLFKRRGGTDEQLSEYRAALEKSPDAVISAMLTNSKATMNRFKFLNTTEGPAVGDSKTGTVAPGLGVTRIINTPQNTITTAVPGFPGTAAAAAPPAQGVPAPGAPPGAGAVAPPAVSEAPQPGTAIGGAQIIATGKPPIPAERPASESDTFTDLDSQAMEAKGYAPGTVGKVNDRTGDVTVTQQPRPTAATRLSPQDSKSLADWRKSAQELNNMRPYIRRFITLNKKIETGGFKAFPGAATVANIFQYPELSEMNSITSKLTPAQRNGLPGAASDRDVRLFQDATVGIEKPRKTNEAIQSMFDAYAARQNDYVAFMEAWANKNGKLLGGQDAWNEYANKYELFDDTQGAIRIKKFPNWKTVFPELKPDAPAAKATTAPTNTGRNRRYNPSTGELE